MEVCGNLGRRAGEPAALSGRYGDEWDKLLDEEQKEKSKEL